MPVVGFLVRVALSIAAGLVAAATAGHLVRPFLAAVFIGAAVGGGLSLALVTKPTLGSIGINDQTARHVFRSLVVGFCFFSLAFLLSFGPLNVDRSFSVWMLRRISTDPGQSVSHLKLNLSEFFSPDSGELERRLDEQVLLGNLKVEGDSISLTPAGERLVIVNDLVSRLFGLNPRYAQGIDLVEVEPQSTDSTK